RLPGRHPGQRARRAVLRGGAEGDPVHPARQPGRHPAFVPAQHHRLHGRQGVRAGRDHQARRDDDQRGRQLHRPAHLPARRRLLRGRPLRDVRAGLRPALFVRLAEREVRGDGRGAAGRGGVDGGARLRRGEGPTLRRRGRRGPARDDREPGRSRIPAAVPVRDGLRRRDHRPARHPHSPGRVPVGHRHRTDRRHRCVRCLPDVSPAVTKETTMTTPSTPPTAPITRVLVANRGEIARRVIAGARTLGLGTAAVYSDPDADAPHAAEAEVAVRLPGASPAATYLRADAVIDAARAAGADAIHPGYGFLSESADFARAVIEAGPTWVGPGPGAIAQMGSKAESKKLMASAGVPGLGRLDPGKNTEADLPVLVKASAGGGGRGMRVVTDLAELDTELEYAAAEAASAFGDDTVFCERYLTAGRHIEVQILADAHGTVWALGERECSIQRRHQKVVEEAPSPLVDRHTRADGTGMRAQLLAAATEAARAIGYVGAGTVEFLADETGAFYFLEMNTRLQVEHPVTELTFGVDLVAWQLRIAAGEALPADPPAASGHAIEVRLYAEDPAADWLPQSGTVHTFAVPAATTAFAIP